jgi:hypothetical protein
MNRREIELKLRKKSRRDLIRLASELKIADSHRMKQKELIEAIVLSKIYRSLPESPGRLEHLKKKDLVLLGDRAGIKIGKRSNRSDLLHPTMRGEGSLKRKGPIRQRSIEEERVEEPRDQGEKMGFALLDENGDLPDSYNETKVVLLPVDPYLIYVYWEVSSRDLEKANLQLGEDDEKIQATLRFYDITYLIFNGSNSHCYFDVAVDLRAKNWYIPLWSPEKSYCVDLGFKTENGRFFLIGRSNVAEVPRAWPSTRVEERYMFIEKDYERIEDVSPPGEDVAILKQNATPEKVIQKERMEMDGTELERMPPKDSAETLQRKLAGIYNLSKFKKLPSGLDLTEMCEKMFTWRSSSKLEIIS